MVEYKEEWYVPGVEWLVRSMSYLAAATRGIGKLLFAAFALQLCLVFVTTQ